MLKLRSSLTALVALGLLASGAAGSIDYLHGSTWVRLEGWADDGSPTPANTAVTVIDFGSDSYAFGYKWSGSASGEDMILALNDQTSLSVAYTDWGAMGIALDELSYDGHIATSDWVNSWLGYWCSTDGVAWASQPTGLSSRALADGDWDGWSVETDVVTYLLQYPPETPVPEPATAALVVAGAAVLLRRRVRR